MVSCGVRILSKLCRLNCGKELRSHIALKEDSEDAIFSARWEQIPLVFFTYWERWKVFVRSAAASKVAEATLILVKTIT